MNKKGVNKRNKYLKEFYAIKRKKAELESQLNDLEMERLDLIIKMSKEEKNE